MEFNSKRFIVSLFVIALGLLYLGLIYGPYSRLTRLAKVPDQSVIPGVGSPVHALWGKVVEVGSDYIVLDVPQVLGVNIPSSSPLRERTVKVSRYTSIIDRIAKEEIQITGEMKAYNPKSGTPPPSPYFEHLVQIRDLQLGNFVMASGLPGVDVGGIREIVAARIIKS